MLKYLPALIIATSQIPSTAQQSQCLNYWVNPNTGIEECLDLQKGLPPTIPIPRTDTESQPPDTPKGYKFLTENEFGDRYFIKVGRRWKVGKKTYSSPAVITHPKFGQKKIDYYSIWCDRRIFRTIERDTVTFYGGSEGSIGYAIWDAACNRE